jgi:hypothetical protein
MVAESRWSLRWAGRPAEEARHLNPAFCGELICRTVCEFFKPTQTPLNFATAFLILPLALHKPTRDILPGRANVAFAGWIAQHNSQLAQYPERVSRLRPITREALVFGIRHELLKVKDGGLVPGAGPVRPTAKLKLTTDDVNEARSAAGLLGRWFASQGSQSSILHGMGIAP